MNTLADIQDILRQVFDNESLTISPETNRRDIAGWDSVAHIKLILTMEDEFEIQFSDDEMSSIETIGDLVAIVQTHKGCDA
jgi:acyl carrier protein